VGILVKENSSKLLGYSAWGFLMGCVLFCGSLYLLCFTGVKSFAIITPFGGVAFMLGWLFLFLGISKK
jgi:uncharacterized membrane protein YgdD (TMEM256/DUF423 family)